MTTVAHDGDVLYASAAGIEYWLRGYKKLVDMATSKKEKTDIMKEADRYREEIKNVVFALYDDGRIKSEEWHNDAGKISRACGPAITQYKLGGTTELEAWYIDGSQHRDGDEPAMRFYFSDGSVNTEQWFTHGQKHRTGKPADIKYYKNGQVAHEMWYQHDKLHCEEQPAVVKYHDTGKIKLTGLYFDGEIHRGGDEPALQHYLEDGSLYMEIWAIHGQRYCVKGPVVEYLMSIQKYIQPLDN